MALCLPLVWPAFYNFAVYALIQCANFFLHCKDELEFVHWKKEISNQPLVLSKEEIYIPNGEALTTNDHSH